MNSGLEVPLETMVVCLFIYTNPETSLWEASFFVCLPKWSSGLGPHAF
jgi:hypothetical protein